MSDFKGLYDIRTPRPADIPFIMATWLRGLYYGDYFFSDIPKDIFMDNYKKVISQTLTNPKVRVNIACLKEDSDVILGYSVVSTDSQAVVWIFVKTAWRQQGIGKSLLPQDFLYATHLTKLGKSLISSKYPSVTFNPFY